MTRPPPPLWRFWYPDPSFRLAFFHFGTGQYLTPRHPAVSGYLWRKWQGQVTELGRNIRLTLFFTLFTLFTLFFR